MSTVFWFVPDASALALAAALLESQAESTSDRVFLRPDDSLRTLTSP